VVAAAVLFVGVVASAVFGVSQRATLAAERRDRRDIQRVSGELATALLTYDYEDLDASRDRVLARATGKFRREYQEAFDSSLETLLTETKATSQGTVTDVFLGDIDAGTVSVIVVANAVADGAAGRRATLASYIQLDLVEVDGRWLVDGVTNLNFGQGSGSATGQTPDQ
jgi:hypothetical protein